MIHRASAVIEALSKKLLTETKPFAKIVMLKGRPISSYLVSYSGCKVIVGTGKSIFFLLGLNFATRKRLTNLDGEWGWGSFHNISAWNDFNFDPRGQTLLWSTVYLVFITSCDQTKLLLLHCSFLALSVCFLPLSLSLHFCQLDCFCYTNTPVFVGCCFVII